MAALFFLVGVLPSLLFTMALGLALGRSEKLIGGGIGVLLFEFIPLAATGVIAAFTSMRTASQRRWMLQSGLVGGGMSMAFAIISGTLAAFFGSDLLQLLTIGILSGAGSALAALVVGSRRPRLAPDPATVF